MAQSQARVQRDVAADTVIGFILVTAISLTMISIVMLMGAPALEQVQSRQQMDSVVGSFQRLDRGVTTLLSGAPAGTAPAWQFSMGQGSLSASQGDGFVWGYAVNYTRAGTEYGFWFGDFADGDSQLSLESDANDGTGVGDLLVQATRYNQADEVDTDTANPGAMAEGATQSLDLDWNLAGNTTQLELQDADLGTDKPEAEAWFIDGGAVLWTRAGSQLIEVYYQNSAIITEIDDGQVMRNAPHLPPPEETASGGEDVFIRVVKINGTVSIGGRSTTELVLASGGNHERHSVGDTHRVQLYPPTRTMDAWQRRLTDESRGYSFLEETDPGGFGTDERAFFRDNSTLSGDLSATLVETDVTLEQTGGS